MLLVSVRLENSARSFIKPSPDDDIFCSDGGSGSGPGRPVAVSAICPYSRHLLFPHPDADEEAAKEGRRVSAVPEGGRQGRHDERHLWADYEVNDKSVQVQIADKVRIEIARAAVGGFQGQDPVVAPDNGNA